MYLYIDIEKIWSVKCLMTLMTNDTLDTQCLS